MPKDAPMVGNVEFEEEDIDEMGERTRGQAVTVQAYLKWPHAFSH